MQSSPAPNTQAEVVKAPTKEVLDEITRERFAELKRKRRRDLVNAHELIGKKFNGIRGIEKLGRSK